MKNKEIITKFPYPGRTILFREVRYWFGCGWSATRGDIFYPLTKSKRCDTCDIRCPWYGYKIREGKEPWVFAIYKCKRHGFIETRLASQFYEHRNK